jgi:hypothetical protein
MRDSNVREALIFIAGFAAITAATAASIWAVKQCPCSDGVAVTLPKRKRKKKKTEEH